jgi:lipopolysaccharide transport system permease protein
MRRTDATLSQTVYTPESQLHSPARLARSMFQDLMNSRDLAWRLFVRDIKSDYQQTMLGYAWAVLPALSMSLAFVLLNQSNAVSMVDTGIPYPAYAITGSIFFALFWESVNVPLRTAQRCRDIIVKVRFPHEALAVTAFGHIIFSFGIKLVLLIASVAVLRVPVKASAVLAVVPLCGLLLLGMAVGLLLVPVGLLFRDAAYALAIAGNVLMFLVPVLYAPPSRGALAAIITANPLTPLLMSARSLIFTGFDAYTIPALWLSVGGLGFFCAAWVVFRVGVPILIERLGSG